MRNRATAAVIVCAAFVATVTSTVSSAFVGDPRTATDMTKTDFVEHAIAGGMAEVAMGELAVRRATNPEVKAFAQRMIDDHSKANQELARLAQKLDVATPTKLDADQEAEAARLATLSGPEFDREYMRSQLADHDETLAIFERQTAPGKDGDVKAWASRMIPTLRSHREQAAQVAQQVRADLSHERTSASRY